MTIKKRTLVIIVASIILMLVGAIGFFAELMGETKRLKLNYHAAMVERDSINGIATTRQMTIRELEQYEDSIVQLLKDNDIKLSRLERVSDLRMNYGKRNVPAKWKPDTIRIPGKPDTIYPGRFVNLDAPCLKASVFSAEGSDTAYISADCDVTGMLTVYRGKRINQHFLFGRPIFRTGPRAPTAQFITDCPDAKIQIRDIEIHD